MSQYSDNRLNELLERFVDAGVPGCSLAVSYEGDVVYRGYRGYARVDEKKQIDKDTVYRLYSNTKNITATAVMILYEQGKILLNDPIYYYLPEFKDIKYRTFDGSNELILHPLTNPLTIKHILTMTSGIPYNGKGSATAVDYDTCFGNGFLLTNAELSKAISQYPLSFDPGTHWRYGLGYDVLGALIEAVTGKSLGKYFKEEIFEPLGMMNTGFFCDEEKEKHLAQVYSIVDGKAEPENNDMFISPKNGHKLESGGGGLLSTLDDMIRFASMWAMGGKLNSSRILSSDTINLMRMNHLDGQPLKDFQTMSVDAYPWYQGYGWGLAGRTLISKQEAGSNGSIGEFGWCGLGGTYILADPDRRLAVAYAQQIIPAIGGMQDYCHPRIRNVVYSLLEEWEK